jgi:hypothetical protein
MVKQEAVLGWNMNGWIQKRGKKHCLFSKVEQTGSTTQNPIEIAFFVLVPVEDGTLGSRRSQSNTTPGNNQSKHVERDRF